MLQKSAELYSEAIQSNGSLLNKCFGFIDCKKIRIARPTGHGSLQRACYSGQMQMHCLIYQIISTPVGFMFCLYGDLERRRHGPIFLRLSN